MINNNKEYGQRRKHNNKNKNKRDLNSLVAVSGREGKLVLCDAGFWLPETHLAPIGVFEADPKTHPEAKRYSRLSYDTVLAQNLKVLDSTAIALCKENNLPIVVFNLRERGNLRRVALGEDIGTIIDGTLSPAFEFA